MHRRGMYYYVDLQRRVLSRLAKPSVPIQGSVLFRNLSPLVAGAFSLASTLRSHGHGTAFRSFSSGMSRGVISNASDYKGNYLALLSRRLNVARPCVHAVEGPYGASRIERMFQLNIGGRLRNRVYAGFQSSRASRLASTGVFQFGFRDLYAYGR